MQIILVFYVKMLDIGFLIGPALRIFAGVICNGVFAYGAVLIVSDGLVKGFKIAVFVVVFCV